MKLRIELDREKDGRWLAEVKDLPGVMAYGKTRTEAMARVQALALRVLADRLEHGEAVPEITRHFLVAESVVGHQGPASSVSAPADRLASQAESRRPTPGACP